MNQSLLTPPTNFDIFDDFENFDLDFVPPLVDEKEDKILCSCVEVWKFYESNKHDYNFDKFCEELRFYKNVRCKCKCRATEYMVLPYEARDYLHNSSNRVQGFDVSFDDDLGIYLHMKDCKKLDERDYVEYSLSPLHQFDPAFLIRLDNELYDFVDRRMMKRMDFDSMRFFIMCEIPELNFKYVLLKQFLHKRIYRARVIKLFIAGNSCVPLIKYVVKHQFYVKQRMLMSKLSFPLFERITCCLQSGIEEVDLLKPNPNHTKYVAKMIRKPQQQVRAKSVNTICWNGSDLDEGLVEEKFQRAKKIAADTMVRSADASLKRSHEIRKASIKRSQKGSKYEFKFDSNGDVIFQGPGASKIIGYISDLAVFISSMVANPNATNFFVSMYFLIRIHVNIEYANIVKFVNTVFDKYFTNDVIKNSRANLECFTGNDEIDEVAPKCYSEFCHKPVNYAFPMFPNLGLDTLLVDHIAAWEKFVDSNKNMMAHVPALHKRSLIVGMYFRGSKEAYAMDIVKMLLELPKDDFRIGLVNIANAYWYWFKLDITNSLDVGGFYEQFMELYADSSDVQQFSYKLSCGFDFPAAFRLLSNHSYTVYENDGRLTSTVEFQGPKEDMFSKFLKIFSSDAVVFEESEFGKASKSALSAFTLAPFILMSGNIKSLDDYDEWYRRKLGPTDKALTMLGTAGSWFYSFLKSGLPYLISKDPIFLNPVQDYEKWIELSNRLYDEINDKPTLARLANNCSYDELATLVSAMSKVGRDLQRSTTKIPNVNSRITSVLAKLACLYVALRKHFKGKLIRAQPLGIFVYGQPGAGKSGIMHTLNAIIANGLGVEAANAVYNVNTSTKHMDNYKEEPIANVDDVGSTDPNIIPDEFVAKLCQICSEFTITTPQADLPDKGNINYNFSAIIVSSNFHDGQFRTLLKNPAAGMRRFELHVHVELKREYAEEGTGQMKQTRERVPMENLHLFSVKQPIAATATVTHYKPYVFEGRETTDMDFLTFCRFVKSHHESHMRRSANARDNTNDILRSSWCNEHDCLSFICKQNGCNFHPVAEGPIEYENLYQFNEVINVDAFDFRKFRNIAMQETVTNEMLLAMVADVVPQPAVGFLDNIAKAQRIAAARRAAEEPVGAVLQGKLSKTIKNVLFYPIRSCVSSVLSDSGIKQQIGTAFADGANDIVNVLTQEEPLNIIGENVTSTNVPSVVSFVKKYKDSLYKQVLEGAGIAVASILGFFILYKGISAFVKYCNKPLKEFQYSGIFPGTDKDEYFSAYKETDAQISKLANPTPPHPVSRPAGYKPEMLELTRFQSNQIEPFMQKVRNNTVHIHAVCEDQKYTSFSGLVLGSNIVFTNYHNFEPFFHKKFVKLVIQTYTNKFILALNMDHLYKFVDRDLAAFTHGGCNHKSISTRILPASDDDKFKAKCLLMKAEYDTGLERRPDLKMYDSLYSSQPIGLNKGIYYEYDTSVRTLGGDCGSPVVVNGDFACVIGLHSGFLGDSQSTMDPTLKRTFLVRIYPSDLKVAENFFFTKVGVVVPRSVPDSTPVGLSTFTLQSLKPTSFAVHLKGFVYPVAYVKPKMKMKSKIRKSLVYNDLKGVKHKIPDFLDKEQINTRGELEYVNSTLVKFRCIEDSPRLINPWLLEETRKEFDRILGTMVDWENVRPASFSNILSGIPGTISGGMNLSTAPGPNYKVHTKRELIAYDNDSIQMMLGEEVYRNIFRGLQCYAAGDMAGFTSFWFPKDEVITPEKENDGRQRSVSLTPMEKLTIAMMVLKNVFLDMRMKGNCHMAVGVNAADPDQWGGLLERFKKVDPELERLVDGDYKFYDAYVWFLAIVLGLIIRRLVCNPWYNKEIEFKYRKESVILTYLDILKAVSGEISQYFVLVDGILVYVLNVTESGGAATAELNSLMETFLHIMIYILTYINHQKEIRFLSDSDDRIDFTMDELNEGRPAFEDNVGLVNYGDDNVDSCSELVSNFYTPEARDRAAKELGFPITDARKNPKLSYVPLKDIVFLKRSFRFDEEMGVYMAPLDEAAIIKLMAFVKGNSNTIETLTVNNVYDGLLQYFMHGRQKYEQQRVALRELLEKQKLFPLVTKWPMFDDLKADYLAKRLQMGGL